MRGLALRVGIVALVLVGGLILRPFLPGGAGELKVGDCFDVPTGQQEVKDVQHHPCDQEHGAEVFFVGDYPGSRSDPYPTDDEMITFLWDKCVPAHNTYTGIDITTQDTYDIGRFQPSEEGWNKGDQGVICYVYRFDETLFRGSLKAG